MAKITDKRFLKYINLTKNDMKDSGHTDFTEELENILETKELTMGNISTLFPFLHYRVNNPKYYKEEFDTGLALGKSYSEIDQTIKVLKKEHKYMYRFVNKFYSIEETLPDFYVVIPRAIYGEVA